MAIDEFPNQELLDEFFIRSGPVPTRLHLQWKEPRIREFIVSHHLLDSSSVLKYSLSNRSISN